MSARWLRLRWSTRGWELFLLLLAQAITALGYYTLVRAGGGRAAWPALVPVAIGTAGWLAVHLLIRRSRRPIDPLLLPIVAMLAGLGQIMVFRLAPGLVSRHVAQLALAALAMGAMVAFPDLYRTLGRYRYSCMALGVLLLVATSALGETINGAQLSLSLGFLSFQPSELVKLLLVVFMAAHLADKREVLRYSGGGLGMSPLDLRYLGPVLVMWALASLLIISQGDLGAALILYGIFLAMLYLGEDRRAHLVVAFLALLGAAWLAYANVSKVQTRVSIWLDPWHDPQGAAYQIVQSLLALGYGGLSGAGLGHGFPQNIPIASTDFVFAAIGEELGLAGAVAVLCFYLVLIWRGLRAALRSSSDFGALLAGGLSVVLALQTIIITGGVCGLLPLTGITLPFVSYGGTSLLANSLLVGLLLAISGGEQAEPGWSRLPPRRVRRLLGVVSLGMVAVVGTLTWWQVYRADWLFSYDYNRRPFQIEAQVPRGGIFDRAGRPLALTTLHQRQYPRGAMLAPVIGYHDPRYGRAGLEKRYDTFLAGVKQRTLQDKLDLLLSDRYRGSDVHLTLDAALQAAAYEALAGHRGAIAAIRPATGEVLALASRPSFDPAAIGEHFDELARAKPAVLLDRAVQGLYPPGSSFKVVTAATALEHGVGDDWSFECHGSLQVGTYTVHCYGGTAHGHVDLTRALAVSCNCAFASLAMQLGEPDLAEQAGALGFNTDWDDFPVPVSRSSVPTAVLPLSELAQSGFGQGAIVATPFQMALVAATVANKGLLMEPYLVEKVTSPTRGAVYQAAPRARVQAIGAASAVALRDMMQQVVTSGTGRAARLPGVAVAGKTGTAENPHGADHAWFICFAPAYQPTIALAVVLENAGPGGRAAAPVARRVLERYFAANPP